MTPRIFLDTNVMLDFLGEREPFYESAARIISLADRGKISVVVSAISFVTVNFFLGRVTPQANAATEALSKRAILSAQAFRKY